MSYAFEKKRIHICGENRASCGSYGYMTGVDRRTVMIKPRKFGLHTDLPCSWACAWMRWNVCQEFLIFTLYILGRRMIETASHKYSGSKTCFLRFSSWEGNCHRLLRSVHWGFFLLHFFFNPPCWKPLLEAIVEIKPQLISVVHGTVLRVIYLIRMLLLV